MLRLSGFLETPWKHSLPLPSLQCRGMWFSVCYLGFDRSVHTLQSDKCSCAWLDQSHAAVSAVMLLKQSSHAGSCHCCGYGCVKLELSTWCKGLGSLCWALATHPSLQAAWWGNISCGHSFQVPSESWEYVWILLGQSLCTLSSGQQNLLGPQRGRGRVAAAEWGWCLHVFVSFSHPWISPHVSLLGCIPHSTKGKLMCGDLKWFGHGQEC